MTDEQTPKDAPQNDQPSENEARPAEPSQEAARPSPQPGETPQPPAQEAAPPAQKRSPVERAIVWGVIAVLAIAAFMEWRTRRNFSQAVVGIRDALRASDESLDDVTLEEAEAMIHGAKFEPAPKQGPYQVRLYRWKGLLRTYTLRLQVTQDDVPIVLAMDTFSDPTAPIGAAYDPYYRPERVVDVDEVPPEERGAQGDLEEGEPSGPSAAAEGPAMKSPPPETDTPATPEAKAPKSKPAQPAAKPKATSPKPQPQPPAAKSPPKSEPAQAKSAESKQTPPKKQPKAGAESAKQSAKKPDQQSKK